MKLGRAIDKHYRQVVVLYTATFLGTLLGLVCSIINTRFLDPVNYGDVRYVQNIIQLIATILTLGYFWSGSRMLALSDNETKSREIRGSMILILTITAVALVLSMALCALVHYNKPKIATLFIVSMPVCVNILLGNYIGNTAQGDNHIGRLAASRLLPYLFYIPLAYIVYTYTGASSVKMLLLQWGVYTIVSLLIVVSTKPSFKNMKVNIRELNKENKNYGLQLYYGSLFMLGSTYIAGISLGVFNSDNSNVGFYTLAMTVTSPLSLLPGIIGTTYFKEFAKMNRIPIKVLNVTVLMTLVSCICFIILVRPFVEFLYSEDYAQVGSYAMWLSAGFCIQGVGDMINRYLGSHGLGAPIRNSSIANGVIKMFGFTLFVYIWGIWGAIVTNLVASTAYCLILAYYYGKFLNGMIVKSK